MSWEPAIAILLGGLPWGAWYFSTIMKPNENDVWDWKWYVHWALKILSVWLITALILVAGRFATDNQASTNLMTLLNVLNYVFVPISYGLTFIFLVFCIKRGVLAMAAIFGENGSNEKKRKKTQRGPSVP